MKCDGTSDWHSENEAHTAAAVDDDVCGRFVVFAADGEDCGLGFCVIGFRFGFRFCGRHQVSNVRVQGGCVGLKAGFALCT